MSSRAYFPVLALDPGTDETGWALLSREGAVESSGITANDDVVTMLRKQRPGDDGTLAIEMIASYGMPVGREVFETCVWIGRFMQAWPDPNAVLLVTRGEVKLQLCGTPRAKDPNVRQALLDLLGPQGTKKAPGPTYGVKSHAWSALGVAVTARARIEQRERIVATVGSF
jgi:hypothetical protein